MIAGLFAYILGNVHVFVAAVWMRLAALDQTIQGRFGIVGKFLFWLLVAYLVLLLLTKAAKLTFAVLKYVLFPAAGLSVLLLMLVPCWSPMKTFPVLAGLCALASLTHRVGKVSEA
jgi:hypothetical protein